MNIMNDRQLDTAKKRTTSLAKVSKSDYMYVIKRVDITKHDGWNFVRNVDLLNIEQVGDIENCDIVVYPIHHDQDGWCCVEWNEEYEGKSKLENFFNPHWYACHFEVREAN